MKQSITGFAAALVVAMLAAAATGRGATISGMITANGAIVSVDLSRSVVYLETDNLIQPGVPDGSPRPQIAQHGKAFVPNFSVVPVGTTVEFPNFDPYSHNVFSRSPAAQFDLDRYGQGRSKAYTFNNPGVVQLFCNIHPQMKAVLLVVPNRCWARADAQGQFTILDVPPGRHVLVGWNDRGLEQRGLLEVPPTGVQGLTLALSPVATSESIVNRDPAPEPAGVARGLGVKRERLDLPVVGGEHAAPGQ